MSEHSQSSSGSSESWIRVERTDLHQSEQNSEASDFEILEAEDDFSSDEAGNQQQPHPRDSLADVGIHQQPQFYDSLLEAGNHQQPQCHDSLPEVESPHRPHILQIPSTSSDLVLSSSAKEGERERLLTLVPTETDTTLVPTETDTTADPVVVSTISGMTDSEEELLFSSSHEVTETIINSSNEKELFEQCTSDLTPTSSTSNSSWVLEGSASALESFAPEVLPTPSQPVSDISEKSILSTNETPIVEPSVSTIDLPQSETAPDSSLFIAEFSSGDLPEDDQLSIEMVSSVTSLPLETVPMTTTTAPDALATTTSPTLTTGRAFKSGPFIIPSFRLSRSLLLPQIEGHHDPNESLDTMADIALESNMAIATTTSAPLSQSLRLATALPSSTLVCTGGSPADLLVRVRSTSAGTGEDVQEEIERLAGLLENRDSSFLSSRAAFSTSESGLRHRRLVTTTLPSRAPMETTPLVSHEPPRVQIIQPNSEAESLPESDASLAEQQDAGRFDDLDTFDFVLNMPRHLRGGSPDSPSIPRHRLPSLPDDPEPLEEDPEEDRPVGQVQLLEVEEVPRTSRGHRRQRRHIDSSSALTRSACLFFVVAIAFAFGHYMGTQRNPPSSHTNPHEYKESLSQLHVKQTSCQRRQDELELAVKELKASLVDKTFVDRWEVLYQQGEAEREALKDAMVTYKARYIKYKESGNVYRKRLEQLTLEYKQQLDELTDLLKTNNITAPPSLNPIEPQVSSQGSGEQKDTETATIIRLREEVNLLRTSNQHLMEQVQKEKYRPQINVKEAMEDEGEQRIDTRCRRGLDEVDSEESCNEVEDETVGTEDVSEENGEAISEETVENTANESDPLESGTDDGDQVEEEEEPRSGVHLDAVNSKYPDNVGGIKHVHRHESSKRSTTDGRRHDHDYEDRTEASGDQSRDDQKRDNRKTHESLLREILAKILKLLKQIIAYLLNWLYNGFHSTEPGPDYSEVLQLVHLYRNAIGMVEDGQDQFSTLSGLWSSVTKTGISTGGKAIAEVKKKILKLTKKACDMQLSQGASDSEEKKLFAIQKMFCDFSRKMENKVNKQPNEDSSDRSNRHQNKERKYHSESQKESKIRKRKQKNWMEKRARYRKYSRTAPDLEDCDENDCEEESRDKDVERLGKEGLLYDSHTGQYVKSGCEYL